MKAELITWFDHCEPSSPNVWWHPDDIEMISGPSIIKSIGWVIREEPEWLVMVGQVTDDGCTDQPLVIVKSCIAHRRELDY